MTWINISLEKFQPRLESMSCQLAVLRQVRGNHKTLVTYSMTSGSLVGKEDIFTNPRVEAKVTINF